MITHDEVPLTLLGQLLQSHRIAMAHQQLLINELQIVLREPVSP